jgi:hypothetical protein
MRNALLKNDPETFTRLGGEIMPEVRGVLRDRDKRELRIFKGVRK